MPRINLLPWREELRKQRQQEFGIMAAVAALLMGGIVFLAHVQVNAMIGHQEQRNKMLDTEIAKLDKKIAEIRNLEKEKENLLARMKIVEQLQTSRPEIVHLFDEMVTALPEGVYLTSLAQTGRKVELKGFAQSNARVSSFMRKLDASPWLENPDLKKIQAIKKASMRLSEFNLAINQAQPKKPKETENE